MNLIDTHAHLYLPEFNTDRTEIVSKAHKSGVEKIVLPNIDSTTIQPMLTLTDEFPDTFYPLIGLHPSSVTENFIDELSKVKEWLAKYKFWGIGEVGIDLYWDKTYKNQQVIAFREQVNIGLETELPVIIHSRESFDEIFSVLDEFNGMPLSGIFHSFTGTIAQAKRAIDMGFHIGINGIVTFKNAGLDKVVKEIGLEKLVLETDSPYLSPVPKRGKRNESVYLLYIAEKLAEIFSCDLETIIATTSKNAMKVFKIN